MIIDDLIEKGPNLYYKNREDVEKELFSAIKESAIHQFEKCGLYRQICKPKNFNPRVDLKSIHDVPRIPYLSTANFKRKNGKPKQLLCVPESEIKIWSMSSGTSGDPSLIGRDSVNLKRFYTSSKILLEDLCKVDNYDWTLFFTPQPQKAYTLEDTVPIDNPTNHMSYMFSLLTSLPMEKRLYALKLADEESRKKGKLFDLDSEKVFSFLNDNISEKGKGWFGGSVPLLYMTLTGYYEKTGQIFDVSEDSVMVLGGGWKKFSGEAVEPEKFRDDINKILNVPKKHMFDAYSFTETDFCGLECGHHNMHIPPWIDVIVRDVETLEPVEIGEKGLANMINPIAYSYAGVSVLQDDIIMITGKDECPCGRKGKTIKIFGRAEGAEAKGCGAQLADETN